MDSVTEQKLMQLFGAGGNFVLPKGLSDKLMEMGDKMRTKVIIYFLVAPHQIHQSLRKNI